MSVLPARFQFAKVIAMVLFRKFMLRKARYKEGVFPTTTYKGGLRCNNEGRLLTGGFRQRCVRL